MTPSQQFLNAGGLQTSVHKSLFQRQCQRLFRIGRTHLQDGDEHASGLGRFILFFQPGIDDVKNVWPGLTPLSNSLGVLKCPRSLGQQW